MICKDCLHYEACKGTYTATWTYSGPNDFDNEHYADMDDCYNFTARSKWVHLPCNVGDTVYYITGIYNQLIKSATIKDITFNLNGITSLFVTNKDGMSFEKDINIFFLSYEEAEKALKD